MSRFSEETFKHWHRPASESEEQRISNAITMIKKAVNDHAQLKNLDLDVFVQGSYGNNTNVRSNSDIDVCVMLRDTFYSQYPEGKTKEDYGFTNGGKTFSTFRKWVIQAMEDKFKDGDVKVGNKSIKISKNSYHLDADVVPAFQYRNYRFDKHTNPDNFYEGVKFFSSQNEEVINYPKIHIENGIKKNKATQKRYKRMIRILKRVKVQMKQEGYSVNDSMTSFLISGLIWNVPNTILNGSDNWIDRVRSTLTHLFNNTLKEENCEGWVEVSEMYYLFHSKRKWTRQQVNSFLGDMWNFLGYK